MSELTLKLVMVRIDQNRQKYLKQHNYCQSLVSLQRESEISYQDYGKEVGFLRKILLKGDFSEAIKFLKTFQSKVNPKDMRKMSMELYKQKLFQLIQNPDENELKILFEKQLVNVCNEEQYQNYFTYLTCRHATDIPGMNQWTITKGRVNCFQQIVPYLQNIFSTLHIKDEIPYQLEQIVELHHINKHHQIKQPTKTLQNINSSRAREQIYNKVANTSSRVRQQNGIKNIYKEDAMSSLKSSRNREEGGFNFNHIKDKIESNLRSSNSSNMLNSRAGKNLSSVPQLPKQSDLDLSQSQYEKSQTNFQKRQRLYANLAPNKTTGERHNQFKDNQDLKNSGEDQNIKSQVYKMNFQSSKIQQMKEQDQKSQQSDLFKDSKFTKTKKVGIANHPSMTIPITTHYRNELQKDSNISPRNKKMLEYQANKNMVYLQQQNSVVEKNIEDQRQNFTFSQNEGGSKSGEINKVTKLAYISDAKAIRTCQYSSSGRYFAVGTNSSYLKIFDIEEIYDKNQFEGSLSPIYQVDSLHQKSIFCLSWSKKQNSLLTCSNDLTIKLTEFGNSLTTHRTNVIGRHQSCIRVVRFNSDQSKVISCGDDNLIKIWDMGKIKKCTNMKGHQASVSAFKLAEQEGESILYSVSKDSTVRRWDLRTCQLEGSSKPHSSQITYIANNTNRLVVSHQNGNVSFYDPSTLQVIHSFNVHNQEIRSIDGLHDQDTFLTASFDGNLSIFNEKNITNPFMHIHNQNDEDKVVYATFLQTPGVKGFASSSTLGLCHLYSYQ